MIEQQIKEADEAYLAELRAEVGEPSARQVANAEAIVASLRHQTSAAQAS